MQAAIVWSATSSALQRCPSTLFLMPGQQWNDQPHCVSRGIDQGPNPVTGSLQQANIRVLCHLIPSYSRPTKTCLLSLKRWKISMPSHRCHLFPLPSKGRRPRSRRSRQHPQRAQRETLRKGQGRRNQRSSWGDAMAALPWTWRAC
jgi:hypothetical protein